MAETHRSQMSRRRRELQLPAPPKTVEFSRYMDGFTAEVPMGSYFLGMLSLGGALAGTLLPLALISSPFRWLALGIGLFTASSAAHALLGSLALTFREGRLHIREGWLGFGIGIDIDLDVNEIRSIKRVERSNWNNGRSNKEAIEIVTTTKSIYIGNRLGKPKLNFVYDTLLYYLDKHLVRS